MSGDLFGVPWWDSRAEPSCTVGTAARHGPRLQAWLTAVCYQRQPLLQRYTSYIWQNPATDKEERKTSYVVGVELDGEPVAVGAGLYGLE